MLGDIELIKRACKIQSFGRHEIEGYIFEKTVINTLIKRNGRTIIAIQDLTGWVDWIGVDQFGMEFCFQRKALNSVLSQADIVIFPKIKNKEIA